MEKRTKEFLQVSFYLSKFGVLPEDGKYPIPPSRLNVSKWTEAYRIFYEKLSGSRTILAFERSLKNARDSYDSHFPNSNRIGWRADNRKPNPLGKEAKQVFEELNELTENQVWQKIQKFSDLNIKEYKEVIEDLISFQESEVEYNKTKTEGGKQLVTSNKYERSISARNEAIKIHGLKCKVCEFDFSEVYGDWGEGFIEVHHNIALSDSEGKERKTNPKEDLTVLCANCHRMIHRKRGITLTIEELKKKIQNNK